MQLVQVTTLSLLVCIDCFLHFVLFRKPNNRFCKALALVTHNQNTVTTHMTRLVSYALSTAAAKEEAEQADKQRREAEAALKKENEPKEGSATQDSTVKPEDTVNTGSQIIVQARAGFMTWPL